MRGRKIQLLKDVPGMERPLGDDGATPHGPPPGATAHALWRQVLARYDDEQLHQAFIRAAFAEGKLKFALDCYRTLEKLRPGDAVAARYLAQVGKAMEVGALASSSAIEIDMQRRLLDRPLRVLILLVLGIGGMLAVYIAAQAIRAAS